MSLFSSPHFLRNVLLVDAASGLGSGALQLAFTGNLSALLGLDPTLLVGTGVFLLVWAAALSWLATRRPVPRAGVWLVVFGNLGWGVACVGLLLAGVLQPTALGTAYVVLQAIAVLLLAELQWFGLRRAPAGRLSMA